MSFLPAHSVDALLSADGKVVALKFTLDGGKSVSIGLDPEHASNLAQTVTALLSSSLNHQTAVGGKGFVKMMPISRATAHATEQPGVVALGLLDGSGLAHYFVLQSETSSQLRSALRAAEAKSRTGVQMPKA
ncbi:hypothetical protein WN72_09465 [Bradyrhizobium arachidis]|uniref:Uncharacterized protein n=1 Tax=Bradyrhizobium arachidis TaxID=858423 RepID=A0AAE7TEX9_9BRAD|nr:hypothetical protein WN72_09465 [Bradyrhizobium arachidis]